MRLKEYEIAEENEVLLVEVQHNEEGQVRRAALHQAWRAGHLHVGVCFLAQALMVC